MMTKELNDRMESLEKRQKIDTTKLEYLMLFGIVIFAFSGVHTKFAAVMRLLAALLWFVDCV